MNQNVTSQALPFTGYRSPSMEPVRYATTCTCNDPECVFRPGYLAAFRDHLARLHHVLAYAHHYGRLEDSVAESWSAVTYHLQMAASIEDVRADAGYVDLRGTSLYCEPAAGYDAEHSDLASRYASALIIFNFVWSAYEAAIKVAAPDVQPRQRTAYRGRELLALHEATAARLPAFKRVAEDADGYAFHVGDLEEDRARVSKFRPGSAQRAAALATAFRNHLAHGSDAPPIPDQDHAGCRTRRFYKIARLLLTLIQVLAIAAVKPADAPYDDDWYEDEPDWEEQTTCEVLANLHLAASRV